MMNDGNQSAQKNARVRLLGVPIDVVTMNEAAWKVQCFLDSQRQHHVMTPNSEMLVESSRNAAFREVLAKSSLNVPDSAGLLLMARLTGQRIPQRVTGTDLMQVLCSDLSRDYPVFLLGAKKGIAERATEVLRERNPQLKIAGTFAGSPSDRDALEIIARINAATPVLLFVAYGAPAQDLWIARHLSSLTSVRVAMGVGGAFDFIAAAQKRAPVFLQKLGLEWAWRFTREPKRWKRMWNAVVVFPLLVLRHGKSAPSYV